MLKLIVLFLILTTRVSLVKIKPKSFIAEFKSKLANTTEAKKNNLTTSSTHTTSSISTSTTTLNSAFNLDFSDVSFKIYNQLVSNKSI